MNKRITIIGDLHGRLEWKEIANNALVNFNKILFVGDYVDSFDIKPAEILYNLKEIIQFKKDNMDDVTLLLGNHDYAYIYDHTSISGFMWQIWQEYKKLFKDNIELFDIAWGYRNPKTQKYTLASHAGLTYRYWMETIAPKFNRTDDTLEEIGPNDLEIHEVLNLLKGDIIIWKVGSMRGGGGTPGPLWADYLELLDDPYPDINQIVGHTAAGTVSVDQFGDYFIAKVDGYYNKKLAHLQLNI